MVTDYRQGDYRIVAERLRPAAALLVTLAAPRAGDLVVDVAAGSGNVARLCTARGARALAVDRVPEQLALGRTDGPDDAISWVAGDARAMPVASGVADAALSTFGLIYAEQPDVAVAETARICRSGGTIGLTAWPADGHQQAFTTLLLEATGDRPPHDHLAVWGTAERIADRFAPVADGVRVVSGELLVRASSVDDWWHAREATPPIASARARLDDDAYDELARGMRSLAREVGEQDQDGFLLRDGYLAAVATVR